MGSSISGPWRGNRGFAPQSEYATQQLKFIWENILQAKFQLGQDRVQFVQRQMMFAVLNPKKRLVGQPDPFRKLSVRKIPSLFSQEPCQITIQIPPHEGESAKYFITYE
jgi:hypothetical protein